MNIKRNVKCRTDQIHLFIIACVIITGNLICRAVEILIYLLISYSNKSTGVCLTGSLIERENRSSEIAKRTSQPKIISPKPERYLECIL